jgi:hypothetical protein
MGHGWRKDDDSCPTPGAAKAQGIMTLDAV